MAVDIEKRRACGRRSYEKNKEARLKAVHARKKRVRAEMKAVINAAKSAPCLDCKTPYPPYVMDFDHVRGEKKFEIGKYAWRGSSMQVLLEEMAKCDVVCSNCHRVRTHKRAAIRPTGQAT